MNGVLGMTERAPPTSLSPEQRDYLTAVRDSARSLLNLLNDVLDFSKIESGKFYIDKTDFSLRECVDSSVQALRMTARDKGLELSVHVDDDVPDWIRGDARRLRQVLVNLVGNAIKFTLSGRVWVDVRRPVGVSPRPEGSFRLDFSVRDTGIGIPQEKQAVIFDAFSQADGSTTRRFGGTGLGLAISSELVAMMEGKIDVDSEVGKGSTFRFSIWLDRAIGHPRTSFTPSIRSDPRAISPRLPHAFSWPRTTRSINGSRRGCFAKWDMKSSGARPAEKSWNRLTESKSIWC